MLFFVVFRCCPIQFPKLLLSIVFLSYFFSFCLCLAKKCISLFSCSICSIKNIVCVFKWRQEHLIYVFRYIIINTNIPLNMWTLYKKIVIKLFTYKHLCTESCYNVLFVLFCVLLKFQYDQNQVFTCLLQTKLKSVYSKCQVTAGFPALYYWTPIFLFFIFWFEVQSTCTISTILVSAVYDTWFMKTINNSWS